LNSMVLVCRTGGWKPRREKYSSVL
jgi:hypothetical protein